jgi:electron transfer flavoprotein beta subunit
VHAVVLLKQILDWELPPRKFSIDPATGRPPAGLGSELMGPFEQNALELALQLRDAGIVERVTALLAGPANGVDSLRKALSVRADEAVLVELDAAEPADPSQTAELLTRAVSRLGSPELVLAGRQAGDWDQGQVGYLVAERLGIPAVGLVWHVGQHEGRLTVSRNGVAGVEKLTIRPPALLTVTNHDTLQLRMGNVLDLMAANKKEIARWTPELLGLAPGELAAARRIETQRVWIPEQERHCEIVEGESPAEAATALVDRMAELKLLAGLT